MVVELQNKYIVFNKYKQNKSSDVSTGAGKDKKTDGQVIVVNRQPNIYIFSYLFCPLLPYLTTEIHKSQ